MTDETPKPEASPSFWKSLPGVLTATAGLVTALTALVGALYPMIQVAGTQKAAALTLKDFSKRTVLEGGSYTIQDGDTTLALSVDDIKVQRRLVFVGIAAAGQAPKKLEIAAGTPQAVVLGSREYLLTVHDLADVIVGADTAQLTLAAK